MAKTLPTIVRFDLDTTPFDEGEQRVGQATTSNYVDGVAHVSWVDSALAGATNVNAETMWPSRHRS